MDSNHINNLFLRSALTEENPFMSITDVLAWIEDRKKAVFVNIEKIKFADLKEWKLDQHKGNLHHNSGRFFSIEGIEVNTNAGEVKHWCQPIIKQPEIGLLGILTKEIDGILYFLLQAKIEPGNINFVQLAPTLQATESNFKQVHKGNKPEFLEYFINPDQDAVMLNQLQSEQGARFLKKRNRNIIVYTKDKIKERDDFIWLTLGQIKKLMAHDNLVNMDTRTVISGIPYGRYNSDQLALFETYNVKNN